MFEDHCLIFITYCLLGYETRPGRTKKLLGNSMNEAFVPKINPGSRLLRECVFPGVYLTRTWLLRYAIRGFRKARVMIFEIKNFGLFIDKWLYCFKGCVDRGLCNSMGLFKIAK